jgi:hypothetical protein
MYKNIIVLIFLISTLSVKSQMIMGIAVVPSLPDDNDTLTFHINSYFPSSGCDGTAFGSVSGPNTITAWALHCQGMLTATCSDIDTVIIPPLPAGNYKFYFTLNAGFGGPPCSPPFVPNDYDSLSFTISTATALSDLSTNFAFSVFPNPSYGSVTLKLDHSANVPQIYFVHNELGELVSFGKFQQQTILEIPNGFYIISVPSLGLQQRVVVLK